MSFDHIEHYSGGFADRETTHPRAEGRKSNALDAEFFSTIETASRGGFNPARVGTQILAPIQRWSFAALTMASVANVVMSPWTSMILDESAPTIR
jgi:hypothetical protein